MSRAGVTIGHDRLPVEAADAAFSLVASPMSITEAGGTTAGVASQYGVVTLVVFVLAAVVILYLWWRRRRGGRGSG